MDLCLIVILAMMMDGGPTVMGIACGTAGALGFASFISGATAATVAYLMKRRKLKKDT